MTSSSLATITSSGISVFWGYITALFPTLLEFGVGIAAVAVVFYLIVKAFRHIF